MKRKNVTYGSGIVERDEQGNGCYGAVFEMIPEVEEQEEAKVVKTKKFQLTPMTVDDAVLQMEMLQHTFYVFINIETDAVNVVYKRKENTYGIIEPEF